MSCDILKIPEEVFYGYIFPYLKQNDLLRLRRVCKQIKLYSEDFIRNNFTDKEIEINENDHTLETFIRLDLPAKQIYLNNSNGLSFFQSPELPEFLQSYALLITHLKVKIFSTCYSESENNFYSALTNLQHLDLEIIDLTSGNVVPFQKIGKIPLPGNKFPSSFKSLKTLKFNKILYSDQNQYRYLMDFINFCPKLEFIRHPEQIGFLTESEPFHWVKNYIEKRHLDSPNEPNLQYYDLLHHRERGTRANAYFLPFVNLCYDRKIKLLNISGELMELVWGAPEIQNSLVWYKYAWTIVSMTNMRRSLFIHELPHMEKLVISGTSKCTFGLPGMGALPRWPNLKILDITVDSYYMDFHMDEPDQIPAAEILAFMFAAVEWVSIKDLSIRFQRNRNTRGNLPCPRVHGIIATCGSVTKLTLTNWLGTNRAVSMLWSRLRHLEEVVLEDCSALGNVAFVGGNKDKPTFLKIKNLKKVTLSGLEKMPKITDLIFELVFRHLTIKQFFLHSREPIKSITVKGIRSLLTGEFNNTVEKFPFSGWSLKGVSDMEFSKLKTEFRSSRML